MTEYSLTLVSGTTQRFSRYGKIIRIRFMHDAGTAPTDGQYTFVRITKGTDGSGLYAFYWKKIYRMAAGGSFEQNLVYSFDVNIDIDKESQILFTSDANGTNMYVWFDFIEPRSAKDRQFVDNLSGLHNSPGGYAT